MSSETTRGVLPRVQWGPVITGVLCALAAQIVLGLFGVAFGFAAIPADDGKAVATLAAIWTLITPIVASFVGAHVAVRIAGDRQDAGAYLHGAMVWCIGLIAGALFITGSFASGAMTAGTMASGSVGPAAIERRDTAVNRTRAAAAGESAARGAAAGTGAAGVAALLGLGGALLGAGAGKRVVTGRGDRGERRRHDRFSDRYGGHVEESGVVYGSADGLVTTRPPATTGTSMPGTSMPGTSRDPEPDDPTIVHH